MERLLGSSGLRLRCKDFTGPLGTLCGEPDAQDCVRAAGIVASYGKGKDEPKVDVMLVGEGREDCLTVLPLARNECMKWIVS